MMYSVALGIRPYGQLEEHYEENMLRQMHFFLFSFFYRAAESHSHHQRNGRQKVSQNSSLLMDGCVFVHVASSMSYIIHSGRARDTEREREEKNTQRKKGITADCTYNWPQC